MAKIGINIKEGAITKIASELVVGIDLGTTNSLISIVNEETGIAETIGIKGSAIVPSVVYMAANGEIWVGENAKKELIRHPESTIFSVKRLLGRSYADIVEKSNFLTYRIVDEQNDQLVRVEVNGKFYTPIELSSMILVELKTRAEVALGKKVSKAVITVPAYFNDNQRQATRDAGKLAGLDVLRIVNEPTAASLAYGIGIDPAEKKQIVVYDLGGGTFDVSILRIENGIFDVLSTRGDTYLGGDDFDREIAQHWILRHKLDLREMSSNENQTIRLLAEKAKIEICNGAKSFTSHFELKGKQYACDLTTSEFEHWISPIIQRTMNSTKLALKDASLNAGDMDEVVLVGGSTRIPLVKQELQKLFVGKRIDDSLNPDEVVALGAAIEADILAGNRRDILLLDVTPLSLGIETLGGLMDVIVTRNSRIPVRAARQYTTSVDGQINLKINIFQGERELVTENRKLAEFVLKNIPAMPAGMPKIEIGFIIDADGILKVSAEELRSGIQQQIDVIPQYGLTDAMVEEMLLQSMKNAKTDMDKRMQIEAKTEAEQIIYATERFVNKNKLLISETEAAKTMELVSNLKNILKKGSKDEILGTMDALNDYTRPFAERLMDIAVAAALKGKQINE